MRTYSLAMAVALVAALVGCGKSSNEPVAEKTQTIEEWMNRPQQTVERQKQQLKQDLDEMAAAADAAVKQAQKRVGNGVRQAKNDLSEYAVEMTEDAKDRALEIPDAIDEFFGTPGEFRRETSRGKKGKNR